MADSGIDTFTISHPSVDGMDMGCPVTAVSPSVNSCIGTTYAVLESTCISRMDRNS